MRAQSLDPRGRREMAGEFNDIKVPVLCNQYAIDELFREQDVTRRQHNDRSRSMPRQHMRYSELYSPPSQIDPTANVRYSVPPSPRRSSQHYPVQNHTHQQKNFLCPPVDDSFIELQVPVKRHRRREKGKFVILCSISL